MNGHRSGSYVVVASFLGKTIKGFVEIQIVKYLNNFSSIVNLYEA